MKKKNVLMFVLCLVITAFAAVPSVAQNIGKEKLKAIIESEIADKQNEADAGKIIFPDDETINRRICKKDPLDYKEKGAITYWYPQAPHAFVPARTCSGLSNFDSWEIQKIMISGKNPDVCTQFDVMSYLISEKKNDDLQKVLDFRYNYRVYVEGKNVQRTLFMQSVLSNNKDALNMLYNKIKTSKLKEVYPHVGVETVDEVLAVELNEAVLSFIPRIKYQGIVSRERHHDAEIELRNNWYKKITSSDDTFVANLDTLEKLIDYRIANCN